MNFNIVSCTFDLVSEDCSCYDCDSKNTYTLLLHNNHPTWIKYKTKLKRENNNSEYNQLSTKRLTLKKPKSINDEVVAFQVGGKYGIFHNKHYNLFYFDKKEINKLNKLNKSLEKFLFTDKNFKEKQFIKVKIFKLIKSLKLQLREFIEQQIKSLNKSGYAIISSNFDSFPYFSQNSSNKYIASTKFGITFCEFENKKEGISLLKGVKDNLYTDSWYPELIIY